MTRKFCMLVLIVLAAIAVGCTKTENTAEAPTTRPGPDNSEITTSVDANGTKTETRVFKNNPQLAKLVVTTDKGGVRTVKAYSASGEERPVKAEDSQNVLEATGSKVAESAGFVASKTADAAGEMLIVDS